VRTFAYYIGGPRDGELVHESLLNAGPKITVPVQVEKRRYWDPRDHEPSLDPAETHIYREAPRMRVGDEAVFRFFISEKFGFGNALYDIVDVLCQAMDHRKARRP